MQIRLYLDEDAQRGSLVKALRERGVDVETANEAGLVNVADDLHLAYATAQSRVLYSFNIGDYNRPHSEYLKRNETHAGIILAPQQRYSTGEQLRRLLRIINTKTAEQMRDYLGFLSAWG
jgi:hypothetical protein